MSRTAQKKRYFNIPWNLQRTKFGPSTTGVVSRGVCLSTCPPTTGSRSGPWWRMTHDSVTPCYSQPGHTTTGSIAALTCMCDFHLNQAQYRFCVCLQSIHDSSDRSQSLFYVLLSLLRQALCMHSDWYQTTRSGILDIITNNVVTLL